MTKHSAILGTSAYIYKNLIKRLLFLCDPESVHTNIVCFGELLGRHLSAKTLISSMYKVSNPILDQHILGIDFINPLGLSAGFDYEGRVTQILPALGFGFETIGTITNLAYEGNPRPMLGRLPKSHSLMVNKGFKNLGAKETIRRLENLSFQIPIGVSVGRSNNEACDTQRKSIEDILISFSSFEESLVNHSYYELNISCPNLFGNVSFYPPKNLQDLLKEIDALHIKKPVFIKMPIERSNAEVKQMLAVIEHSSIKGVIFGNLQKDRTDKTFNKKELEKFPRGNFSGKPTFHRSNELIKIAFELYKDRFVIIGCGGVFTGNDAYQKIKLGATLVQLITGVIFNGPQLIAQINLDLINLLKQEGFTHISQAIGSGVKG